MKSVFENKIAWLIVVAACVVSIILVCIRNPRSPFWNPPNVAFVFIAFFVSVPQISIFVRKRFWDSEKLSVRARALLLLALMVVSAVVFYVIIRRPNIFGH